jgi:hypothetical protein
MDSANLLKGARSTRHRSDLHPIRACPRDRKHLCTLQLPEPNAGTERLGSAPEANPSARVEHATQAVRPRVVRPPSFFTDVGRELTTRGSARMHASHLPPECKFWVRVQVQIIGGETREILGDTECRELALDLNGRRMAKLVLWIQSEQECYLCVTSRDSNGAVTALVPNPQLDGSKPFIVRANHPPVRVPPERQVPEQQTSKRKIRSVTVRPPEDRSKLESRSATKSYAIGIPQGALYEVRHGRPVCGCELASAV